MQIIKEPEYSKRRKAGRCVAAFCQNKGALNKGKHERFCACHKKHFYKENSPLSFWFSVLKQNARRRGKDFTLTLAQFGAFCERTGYLRLKGKHGNCYTIDRIDNERGYHEDNIQMITCSQNSRKSWIDMKLRFGRYLTPEELAFYDSVTPVDSVLPEDVLSASEEDLPF